MDDQVANMLINFLGVDKTALARMIIMIAIQTITFIDRAYTDIWMEINI